MGYNRQAWIGRAKVRAIVRGIVHGAPFVLLTPTKQEGYAGVKQIHAENR